jgi:hypothetical protein
MGSVDKISVTKCLVLCAAWTGVAISCGKTVCNEIFVNKKAQELIFFVMNVHVKPVVTLTSETYCSPGV